MSSDEKVKMLLGSVFDDLREGVRDAVAPDEYAKMKEEFVFHMSDWADDLADFADLFANPGQYTPDSASTFVAGFLYHVVPHLNAACRLLLNGEAVSWGAGKAPG